MATLTLVSCIYDTDEEFLYEIEKTEIENIQLELSFEDDTVELIRESDLWVSVFEKGEPKAIDNIVILLGDSEFDDFDVDGNKIKITLKPSTVEEKYDELKLTVELKSESNSLLDQFGGEIILIEAVWQIHFNGVSPTQIVINEPEIIDGQLTLRWPEADRPAFDYYYFSARYYDANDNYLGFKFQNFQKDDDLIFEDKTFSGGKVEYLVSIVTESGQVTGEKKTFKADMLTNFEYEILSDQSLKLSWDNILLYRHDFNLQILITAQDGTEELIAIDDMTTSEFTTEAAIDLYQTYDIDISVNANNPDFNTNISNSLTVNEIPNQLRYSEDIRSIAYNAITNSFYVLNDNYTLYQYDRNTMDVTDEVSIGFTGKLTISDNGEHAYAFNQNLRECIKFNTSNINSYEIVDIPSIVGFETYDGNMIVTDNNLMQVRANEQNKTSHYLILEMNSNEISLAVNFNSKISPDGVYVYNSPSILAYKEGTWTNVFTIEETMAESKWPDIFIKNSEYYLVNLRYSMYSNNQAGVYQWNAGTAESSILNPTIYDIPATVYFINHDPVSEYMLCKSTDDEFIYEFTNFSLKFSGSRSENFFYNGLFISTNGKYSDISIE